MNTITLDANGGTSTTVPVTPGIRYVLLMAVRSAMVAGSGTLTVYDSKGFTTPAVAVAGWNLASLAAGAAQRSEILAATSEITIVVGTGETDDSDKVIEYVLTPILK